MEQLLIAVSHFFMLRDNSMRFSIMADGSGLLEKEITAFAAEKASVRRKRSSVSRIASRMAQPPVMDELLEDTLVRVKLAGSLTAREAEILKLIFAGKTNKKIAQALCRTERTVEYHRHRLMRKVGARTAADLVKRAIAMGLV